MKKGMVVLGAVVLCLLCAVVSVNAQVPNNGKERGSRRNSIETKLFQKAHAILRSADTLGLSDAKVAEINKLKLDTQKALIRQKAEVDVIKVDMLEALSQTRIDVEKVNSLIDQKIELEKQKAKFLVSSYAQLGNMLTEEQCAKLKEKCLSKKQCKKQCMPK